MLIWLLDHLAQVPFDLVIHTFLVLFTLKDSLAFGFVENSLSTCFLEFSVSKPLANILKGGLIFVLEVVEDLARLHDLDEGLL